MTTAAAGNYWPPSPPLRSSPTPDTTSPVFPDRPIRPLPKRRLRDRLSSEQSDTLQLPPHPPNSSPIFAYPYSQGEREHEHRGVRAGSGGSNQEPCVDCGVDYSEEDYSGEDEDDEHQRTMQFSPRSLQITRRDGDYYGNGTAAVRADWESKHAPPGSTASDEKDREEYDPFENKNKKKRKIPQSNIHHSTLSSDMANMGISQRDGAADIHDESTFAATSYGQSTPSPTGSGAAPSRSKYGRSGRGSLDRRPLGSSTNGLNATAAGGRARQTSAKIAGTSPVEPGIISAAIANAQQTPTTPTKGQENISLLQQQASKSPPQKTDFTFTPEGGENRPVWPGQQGPPGFDPAIHQGPRQGDRTGYRRNGVAHGTQTSPNMNGAPQMPPGPNPAQGQATGGAQPPPPKGKKKKKLGRALEVGARQRRLQQEYANFHNPPKREDIWICEFCEYETIYGEPPKALIRQYEIKDREERKRAAERRRLLEKAKMKGRKGKKSGNKKNNTGNQATTTNNGQHSAATNSHRNDAPLDDQLGDDDYYEDDEYEYPADPAMDPPPPPTPHPASHAHHTHAGADPGYIGDLRNHSSTSPVGASVA